MPIYEFACSDCGQVSTFFVRTVYGSFEARCHGCGSTAVSRIMSSVAFHRSEQSLREEFDAPDALRRPDAYRDPRQIGRWVERKFQEYGLELPKEARTMIDAAREGEFPKPLRE